MLREMPYCTPGVLSASSVDAIRKTSALTTPIQWRTLSERCTTAPASSRDGKMENNAGATTNEKKMMPPIQTTSDNSMRKRAIMTGKNTWRTCEAEPVLG